MVVSLDLLINAIVAGILLGGFYAAVMNAIADALPEDPDIDMPATPERVWRAIHHRKPKGA